jgi:hypothetical protein
MRNDKDNTRRIGGLMLDLLMLSFIIAFSFADVKITDSTANTILTVQEAPDDHIIIRNFDSLFASFQKHISKVQPHTSHSLGVIFDFLPQEEAKRIVLADSQYSYNAVCADTRINAP